MPSRSRTNARSSLSSSSTVMPLTSSEAIDAAAWLIAQPWPSKRMSSIAARRRRRAASPSARRRRAGCCPRTRGRAYSIGAPVVGPLVVLEDLLAVEVVHQSAEDSPDARRGRRPGGRRRRACCGRRTRRASSRRRRSAASAAARSGGRRARRRRGGRGSRRRRAGATPRARTTTSAPRAVGVARAVDRQPGHVGEALERVAGEVALVRADRAPCPIAGTKSTAAPRPIASAIVRRAGLELRRRPRPADLVEAATDGDHVPAAEERRHRLEQLAAAVQDADAGRAVGLVPGPGVEVGVDRADVDRASAARPASRRRRTTAPAAWARRDDLGDRVDRARRRWRRGRRRRA